VTLNVNYLSVSFEIRENGKMLPMVVLFPTPLNGIRVVQIMFLHEKNKKNNL